MQRRSKNRKRAIAAVHNLASLMSRNIQPQGCGRYTGCPQGPSRSRFLGNCPDSGTKRFLAGGIGQFVVIARRSGADWFLGAMMNELERTLMVSAVFLGKDRFNAKIYADGDTPSMLSITERVIEADGAIALKLVH